MCHPPSGKMKHKAFLPTLESRYWIGYGGLIKVWELWKIHSARSAFGVGEKEWFVNVYGAEANASKREYDNGQSGCDVSAEMVSPLTLDI